MRSRGCGRSVIVIVRRVACRIVRGRVRSARIAGTRVRRSRRTGRETRRLLRRAGLFARRVVGDLVAIVDGPLARIEFVACIQNGLTRSEGARVGATVHVVGVAVRTGGSANKDRGRNGQIGKRFHNLTDHKESFGHVRARAPTLVVRPTRNTSVAPPRGRRSRRVGEPIDARGNRAHEDQAFEALGGGREGGRPTVEGSSANASLQGTSDPIRTTPETAAGRVLTKALPRVTSSSSPQVVRRAP